jgi:hypothetical protein
MRRETRPPKAGTGNSGIHASISGTCNSRSPHILFRAFARASTFSPRLLPTSESAQTRDFLAFPLRKFPCPSLTTALSEFHRR